MKIINSSFDSVSNLYRDLKNNLTVGKLGWLFIYCLFVLYTEHFVNNIIGSEGIDPQLIQRIVYYIQNFPVLLFVLYFLQDIYLKIITSDNIVFSKTTDKIQYIKLFRLFLFTVFIGYLAFGILSIFEYGITLFIITFFIEAYLLILAAFILIERPSNGYFLSIFLVIKVIGLQIFKIIAAMLIVGVIYEIIFIPLYAIPEIYKLSIALISKVPVVDNSVTFILLSSVCYFVECYIGIILYAKLSIHVYLSFKNRILYEMKKSEK